MSKVLNFLGAMLMTAVILAGTAIDARASQACEVKSAFSPRGGGVELIMSTIESARTSILMATYSLTEPRIGKALLDAKRRGVDVRLVVDKDHNGNRPSRLSVASFLSDNGVPLVVTHAYKIQHNKYIVVDGVAVQTGSYNYSRAAENDNAENVVVLRCKDLADAYTNDWMKIWVTGQKLS